MIARFKLWKLIDYKLLMGLLPSESILEDQDYRNQYFEVKKKIEQDFEKANLDVYFDFDKKVYLDEIYKHLEQAMACYHNK